MFAARPRPGPASGFFAPGRMSWPRGGRRAARCGSARSAAGDGGAVGLVRCVGAGSAMRSSGSWHSVRGRRPPAAPGLAGADSSRCSPVMPRRCGPGSVRVRAGSRRRDAGRSPWSGVRVRVRSGRWRLERWPCGPPAVARAGLAVRRFRLAHRTLGPPGGGRAPTPPNPAGTTCPLPDDCSSSLLKRNFLRSHRWCGFCGKPSCSQLSGVWTGG